MKKILGSAVLLVALTGCASIVSKSDWPVTITSAEPTDFTLTDENGMKRAAGRTPTTLILPASDGYFDGQTYTLTSSVGTQTVNSRLNGWYLGNLVLGGALGLLIVDPITGAMWRLPEVVDLGYVPAARPASSSE